MAKHDSELTLHGLKASATKTAKERGHGPMRPWTENPYRSRSEVAHTACMRCGASVTVSTRPMPNETWIAGSAMALTCDGAE